MSEKVNSGIDAYRPGPSEGLAARLAQDLYQQNQAEIDELRQQFKHGVRDTWASALAEVRDLSFEFRKLWLVAVEGGTSSHRQSI